MHDWNAEVRAALSRANLEPGREELICEEVAQHLSEQYAELLARDVPEAEARAAVRQELASQRFATDMRATFRSEAAPADLSGEGKLLTGIRSDVRLAARQLRLNPGFAVVAIVCLALGIGANAAIFELVDAVLLRTLPVQDPQSLAEVRVIHQNRMGDSDARQDELSSALWTQLQQRQRAFSSIAAWSTERLELGRGGNARYADGLWVSGSFFQTLQLRPELGRFFESDDDRRTCTSEGAVISYGFWQSALGGQRDVLRRTLTLDGQTFPIIGVTRSGFSGLEVGHTFDVALSLCSEPLMHPEDSWTKHPTTWWLDAIGRLKPGWSVQRASAQLSAISPAIFRVTLPSEYDAIARASYLRFVFRAAPAATGTSSFRDSYQRPLLLLFGVSVFVLLIACANLANLMMVRATARRHEIALRFALGASRLRVMRQLLLESLLVAVIGASLGGALAHLLSTSLVSAITTQEESVYLPLFLDWRVLAFTSALAIFTCVLFGAAPAFGAAKTDPGTVIKSGGRGATTGREGARLRRGFTVLQVALSLALVVTALLFVRTFRNLATVSAGFEQDHVLVAHFDFSRLQVPPRSRLQFKRDLLERVRAVPGVASAAITNLTPLSGNRWNDLVDVPNTGIQRRVANFSAVTSDYFQTLCIPLRTGRDFNSGDTLDSGAVAIVNEVFAKSFFGGRGALGKTFGVVQDSGKPDKIYQVVGVVGNTKYVSLREEYSPIAFLAEMQDASPDPYSTIMIRSEGDLGLLMSALKSVAAQSSPDMMLHVSVLQTTIRDGLLRERLIARLSAFYGALAVLLSIVGLYGVMSHIVMNRRGEIGVRVALGASRVRTVQMILMDSLSMVGLGVVAGTALVIGLGRAVQSMLYGLTPHDPASLVIAIAGLVAVAALATLLPAQRAAEIDPMTVLRQE